MKASLSPEARLAFLWQASHALSASLDYQTTLRTVARLLVPTLADWVAVDLGDERGGLERLAVVDARPDRDPDGRGLHQRYPPDSDDPLGPARVYRTGEPVLIPRITDDLLVRRAGDAEHLRLLRSLGLSSALIVPLGARERPLGTLSLVTAESGRQYGADELALVQELAGRAGLSPATLSRLAALERSLGGRPVSPGELASALGITDPSGRRLIRKLGEAGLAIPDGSTQPHHKGRPARLYRLAITSALAAVTGPAFHGAVPHDV